MRLPFARRRPGRRPIKDQVVEARQFSARALTAFVIVSSALLLLVARFVYLQVIAHEDFVTRSVNNQVKVLPVPPNRGLIYDRRGRPIAENRPAYRLEIVPEKIDDLEQVISEFNGTDDTILYSSCFDANAGLFETILGAEDAIISDELNHASIIDGIRLCKAARFRYKNNDMTDLEAKLKEAQDARFRLIATDGSFSMDGIIANLKGICDLADRYDALVMVDDSHSTGFIGKTGRGTLEYHGVMERVDIITSTFGKALGGASGGFTSGRKEIIDMLRQRSRPYLFSNTLAPGVAAAVFKALETLSASTELRDRLERNTRYFREGITKAGFKINPGDHPIVPMMLGDAKVAVKMADAMLAEGVYVIAFSYPVVPKGKARIRVQISAALTTAEMDTAIAAFTRVGKQLSVI